MPLKKEELHYLAGIYEATIGLRSISTLGAAAISNTPEWPQYMAATFGGQAEEFTTGKGKKYWGWFTGLDVRLALLAELRAAKVLRTLTDDQLDAIQAKLEKAYGKKEG